MLTHSSINCDVAFRETVGIAYMQKACRLWYINFDHPFTERKEDGEVVGSLPPHNSNAPFYNKGMEYVCNRKSLYIPKLAMLT